MEINKEVEEIIKEADQLVENENYPGESDEYKRQRIIQLAVRLADSVIMKGSDGSREETDYLTAKVAEAFNQKVLISIQSRQLAKQLKERT